MKKTIIFEDGHGHELRFSIDEDGEAVIETSEAGEDDGSGWASFSLDEFRKILETLQEELVNA